MTQKEEYNLSERDFEALFDMACQIYPDRMIKSCFRLLEEKGYELKRISKEETLS